MKWMKFPRIAVKSLLKNKTRSLLTSLGIIIGVGSVIVMVSIGQGSQADIEESIKSLGTNMIMIMPGSSNRGGVSRGAGSENDFTMDDVEYVEEHMTCCTAISPVVGAPAQVIGGSGNWNTSILGVGIHYLDIRSWGMDSGEFFTSRDIRSKSKVAVLGQTVADELFPNENPIGQRIRIRNTPFRIIGVLSEKGQDARGRDEDDVIIAPATTVLYRLKGGENIDMMMASARSVEVMDQAQEELADLLRIAHKIMPTEDDDFHIRSQTEIIERFSEVSGVMTMLLGSIAGVSLVVGGIGIMNIMLVSVTERTREIGIRLAIGARESDILTQFLLEAGVLSLAGGILGVIVAFSVAAALNSIWNIPTVVSPFIVFLSLGFAAIIGLFFGFYPARKAAILNPIDALRHE